MSLCSFCLITSCGEFYQKVGVVGLNFCFVSRLVSYGSTAPLTAVNYDITALCIGECLHGAENTATFVLSVARVYINVKRAKAKRAVVSRRVAEGQDLFAAVFAYKAAIVFRKSFSFHKTSIFLRKTLRKYLRQPLRTPPVRQALQFVREPFLYQTRLNPAKDLH